MSKIKEVFELKDGHTFAEVSKRKAKKLFTDTVLQERVLSVLNNEGKVFATHEKKDLVCYYIFERVKMENSLGDEENTQNDKAKTETWAYKLVEVFWNPEKEHWRETFENTIRVNLKEYISLGMAELLIWDEDVYVLEKNKKQGFSITGIAIGVMFGISFGTSMDNWALGIPMAFMWAMVFNMLFSAEESKLVKRGE